MSFNNRELIFLHKKLIFLHNLSHMNNEWVSPACERESGETHSCENIILTCENINFLIMYSISYFTLSFPIIILQGMISLCSSSASFLSSFLLIEHLSQHPNHLYLINKFTLNLCHMLINIVLGYKHTDG